MYLARAVGCACGPKACHTYITPPQGCLLGHCLKYFPTTKIFGKNVILKRTYLGNLVSGGPRGRRLYIKIKEKLEIAGTHYRTRSSGKKYCGN